MAKSKEDLDDLYEQSGIFANREIVRVGHVPSLEKVVGRETQIKDVIGKLRPAVRGEPPQNLVIYGKTGTGKSLVARSVTRETHKRAESNGNLFVHSYVDCSDADTETSASRSMLRGVVNQLGVEQNIPSNGVGSNWYRSTLYDILNNNDVDTAVIILDEIDKLDGDDVLMALSRAEETGKTDTYIGIVCISNKIGFRERLSERVDSSLQDTGLVFDPYNANQLRDILQSRQEAFCEGVLNEDVIPKIAALAAQEHGDARKAMVTLHQAGVIAENNNDSTVTLDHVDKAQHKADVSRLQDLIRGHTPHVKYVISSLASLTINSPPDQTYFKTLEIYGQYEKTVEQHGSDPLTYDRVRRLLKEQEFLEITESKHTGGGRNQGSYLVHRLLHDADVVTEALEQSDDFEE